MILGKYFKRNFITFLLFVSVVFSFSLPCFAAGSGRRATFASTDTFTAIKQQLTTPPADDADVYSAFLGLFAADGSPTVTDSAGWVWYPANMAQSISPVGKNTTSSRVYDATISGNRYQLSFSVRNGSTYFEVYPNYNFNVANLGGTGTYYLYILGSCDFVAVSRKFNDSGPYNTFSFAFGRQHELTSNRCDYMFFGPSSSSADVWATFSADLSFYWVKVAGPDMGASGGFTGFGGGTTRGGGAGRRYDLIPSFKADGIAVGGAVTDADVLTDYALFDENTKTVSIPQSDGSTVTYTAATWVYNYDNRTYNITTNNNTTVYITYGDDKASVTDGSNPTTDYYYVASDSSSGDSGGGSGDSFWDKILGGLADGILGFFKAIGTVLASILTGFVNLLTDVVSSISTLIGLIGSVGTMLGSFYTFLPPEVQSAVSAALIVIVTISVISIVRK